MRSSEEPLPETTGVAGPRQWLGLAVLALPTLLLSLDITVLNLGVPHLSADLQPTSSELLWIIDIYGFMIAGFLITMGTLGDRIGRRRLLMLGAAVFGAASIAAAFASSPSALILSRAVMGIAGATLMPSTLALISSMFPVARQRGLAIGIWATMFSAGIALGPIVGGALLEHFWWGSVFLLGVPVMVLLLIAAPLLLPEFRAPDPGRLDLLSVALLLATMLGATFGIKEVAAHGAGPVSLGALAIGATTGAFFIRRQRRLDDPLLDLRLFENRTLRSGLTALLISTATIGGIYLFITQYLQLVAGHSPLVAGLLLLPAAGMLIVASLVAPLLARRIPSGAIIAASLTVSAAGFVVLSQVPATFGMPVVLVGFTLAYAGIGPVTALGTDLVLGSAPPERAGAASALSETSTELGVALEVAVLGSIGTAFYRFNMPSATVEAGTADAFERARETPAEALQAAAGLSGEIGVSLASDAVAAFMIGFSAVGWIGAALLLLAAALTVRTLRSTTRRTDSTERLDEQPEPLRH